ncbi:MAG: 5'-nucleotidase C-terminal domain-containing protein [bacterium]
MKRYIFKLVALCLLSSFWMQKSFAEVVATTPKDTIAIICLNDFHGSFVQDKKLAVPGAACIYAHVDSLKQKYKNNIVIAAGDNFGGSYFSIVTKGSLIPSFFNELGITVSAIGNHEFDNGQEFLANKWKDSGVKDWTIDYICANLFSDSTCKTQPSYVIPEITKDIAISEDDVLKVRLIGLVTASAKSGTSATDIDSLVFLANHDSIINTLYANTNVKADMNILVAHVGTEMIDDAPAWMESYITPPKDFDGISSGHSHKFVIGNINGMPVVQGEISGKYISVLLFERSEGVIRALPPEVNKVNLNKTLSGVSAEIEKSIDNVLDTTVIASIDMKLSANLTKVVGDSDLIHDRNINPEELTSLGTYACMSYADAYREVVGITSKAEPIIAFSQFGAIRRSMPLGDITVLDAGEVLPFESPLKVYRLTGEQIKAIMLDGIKVGTTMGQMQMNTLEVDLFDPDEAVEDIEVLNISYVYPNVCHITLSDDDKYIVVVDQFITNGGDGYDAKLFPEDCIVKDGDGKEYDLKSTTSFLKFLKSFSEDLNEDNDYKAKFNFWGL